MIKKFLQFIPLCRGKKNRAFTLVETLVAISIFTMSILGLMSVLASGISNTNYAKNKIIASYLAQEGIEYIRNMRDSYVLYATNGTWNNFKSKLASCNSGGNECGFNTVLYSFPLDNDFIKKCNTGLICNVYLDNGTYHTNEGASGVDSGFVRKIWMTTYTGVNDEVQISSSVSWTQGSGNYNITFSENLFNWTE